MMPGVRTTVSHASDAATGAGGFQGGAVLGARLVSGAAATAAVAAGTPTLSAAAPAAPPGIQALDCASEAQIKGATKVTRPNARMSSALFYGPADPSIVGLPAPTEAARVGHRRNAGRPSDVSPAPRKHDDRAH